MKLQKLTLLLLASTLAVTSCAKKKQDVKAVENPDATKTNAATAGKTPPAPEAFKGQLVLGENKKAEELINLIAGTSDDKVLSKSYVPIAGRLKATAATNDTLLKVNALYDVASKKLSIAKTNAKIKVMNVKEDGTVESIDLKTIAKAPTLTIAEKPVEVVVDEKAKEYVSKDDLVIDVADASKAVTAKLSNEDETLKIAETAFELSPIVTFGTAEEPSAVIALDLSKGEVPADLTFAAGYAGAEGDPTKPECVVVSTKGIGEVKPIVFHGIIDVAAEDHLINFSKIKKEELAKIPTGEMEIEIKCARQNTGKTPSGVLLTVTKGLKIKVTQAEVKKEEPKKDPPAAPAKAS